MIPTHIRKLWLLLLTVFAVIAVLLIIMFMIRARSASIALEQNMQLQHNQPHRPPAQETRCNDLVDNDWDGMTDCEDADCKKTAICKAPAHAAASICGNGVREGKEECDDGNIMAGDGCSWTCEKEDVLHEGGFFGEKKNTGNRAEFTDSELTVSLSPSNPIGDSIPKGSTSVTMLSVDFTASCDGTAKIQNLTLLHEGNSTSEIEGIYAVMNGDRRTQKALINRDQTSDLRFMHPLVLDPCETVTVDIVGDFIPTAKTMSEHTLVIEHPSDVSGNTTDIGGTFPIRGNTFKIAAVTSGTAKITYGAGHPDTVTVGDTDVVIGAFDVSMSSTEDQTLYSLTLHQSGSASDGDIENIAVRKQGGRVLTNTAWEMKDHSATVVFDPPFTMLAGDTATLEIIADIVGGSGKSIIMHFAERSDLFAVGSLYGYGVNGQLYGSQIVLPKKTSGLPDAVRIR